jgi:phosphoribosyl 1,2-cyclic phosphodiesterase
MLVVDCGKVPIDTKGIVDAVNLIKSSNPTIRLNGIFITHGHPDHAANAYSVQKALGGPRVRFYPASPEQFRTVFLTIPVIIVLQVFVGSPQIKNELLNLINIFAKFDDPSSPGNPRGNSTNKWDYVNQIIAVQSRDEIWDTDDVELITDAEFNSVAETDHFAILYLPNDNAVRIPCDPGYWAIN